MRPTQMELLAEMDEQGGSMAMDVDDIDPIEVFGEGFFPMDSKLTDADFFNSFEDDFDDSDIN
ncbi:small acidic protein 1 [Tripterygium wilfordii]|uniref:Small acidic protein 1 n=1 Tax=Tripterygium wilfordii TaxID=458696 RepID=A0A7J7CRI1_TRIWF|nr:small acidic protein 1 [Tripterygium wilfordii]KAF5736690.1 small acidic protein 1 [Tripterygium wilfordii]